MCIEILHIIGANLTFGQQKDLQMSIIKKSADVYYKKNNTLLLMIQKC